MSVEDEESFKLGNKCWICNKLFTEGYNKVRDHGQNEVLFIEIVILLLS